MKIETVVPCDAVPCRPLRRQVRRQKEKFCRDRARAVSERKKRVLTGEAWELRADAVSKLPFWYNRDTGEPASQGRPNHDSVLRIKAVWISRKLTWI